MGTMTASVRCSSCMRHMKRRETRCPFCGEVVGLAMPPRVRAARAVLLSVVGLASCTSSKNDELNDETHNSGVAYGPPSYTYTETETYTDSDTTAASTSGDASTDTETDTGTTGCEDTGTDTSTSGECDTSTTSDTGDTSSTDTGSETGTTSG